MRTILRIMKIELGVYFFSPIAWLVLVVFAFQLGLEFCNSYGDLIKDTELGYRLYNVTMRVIGGYGGVLSVMLDNLYLYIPLLTMSLVSRELSSGTIKLLYSSPVSNVQIILGKYLSVLVYGLILLFMVSLPVIFVSLTVKSPDIPLMLTALLGFYLTISSYAAIGLFMSTITKYQVVAVVGTLAILAVLNFIGGVGQDIDFVRDLTYWLSISGRSKVFLEGLISTNDILYFVLVIFMFISLAIVKLQGERLKLSKCRTFAKYFSILFVSLMIGYISSMPKMIATYDATEKKMNTLAKESQEIMKQLDGGLTITTYVNFLDDTYYQGSPSSRNWDLERFEKYIRFKPEIKMEYVYYYGKCFNDRMYERYPNMTEKEIMEAQCEIYNYNPKRFISAEEVQKVDDISSENGRFVRVIKRDNGAKAFLRTYEDQSVHPTESEITTALKTLICHSPIVAFVTGHGERGSKDYTDKGYGVFARNNTFRYSLVNRGFRVLDTSLKQAIADSIDVLVIADMRSGLTEEESINLDKYIARGGDLFILGEPKRVQFMNPVLSKLGLKYSEGVIVRPTEQYLDDIIAAQISPESEKISPYFTYIAKKGNTIITPSACAVEVVDDKGFDIVEMLKSNDKGSWVETETTDFINEKSQLNVDKGEVEKSNSIMLHLSRKVNDKLQRIMVVGDADCISSLEMSTNRAGLNGSNFSLVTETFRIFSDFEYPVETTRERGSDTEIYVTKDEMVWIKIVAMWLIPIALLVYSMLLLLFRKRK